MMGLAGLTLTSATGAKFWWMPRAASSVPEMRAAVRASDSEWPAPSAIAPGNWVAPLPTRTLAPCSWSMEIREGMGVGRDSEARCTPFDSSATWRGSWMLFVQPEK